MHGVPVIPIPFPNSLAKAEVSSLIWLHQAFFIVCRSWPMLLLMFSPASMSLWSTFQCATRSAVPLEPSHRDSFCAVSLLTVEVWIICYQEWLHHWSISCSVLDYWHQVCKDVCWGSSYHSTWPDCERRRLPVVVGHHHLAQHHCRADQCHRGQPGRDPFQYCRCRIHNGLDCIISMLSSIMLWTYKNHKWLFAGAH